MAIDNKKEQEREELHRAIWAIADDLRGAVDGWDFKSYVLGTMFYRYISENLTAYINSGEEAAGNKGFDYAKMSDSDAEEARAGLVEEIQTERICFSMRNWRKFSVTLRILQRVAYPRVVLLVCLTTST